MTKLSFYQLLSKINDIVKVLFNDRAYIHITEYINRYNENELTYQEDAHKVIRFKFVDFSGITICQNRTF